MRIIVGRQAVMMFVAMMRIVLGFAPTFFAMEHDKVLAERIKRGNKHARQHGEIGKTAARQMAHFHGFNNAVFGIKAREQRCANQREIAQQHGEPSNRHIFAQAAHVAHILVVMHADDDAARRQEQQGFEKGVRHHMEHGNRIRRHA